MTMSSAGSTPAEAHAVCTPTFSHEVARPPRRDRGCGSKGVRGGSANVLTRLLARVPVTAASPNHRPVAVTTVLFVSAAGAAMSSTESAAESGRFIPGVTIVAVDDDAAVMAPVAVAPFDRTWTGGAAATDMDSGGGGSSRADYTWPGSLALLYGGAWAQG